jgi:hypothetical protein
LVIITLSHYFYVEFIIFNKKYSIRRHFYLLYFIQITLQFSKVHASAHKKYILLNKFYNFECMDVVTGGRDCPANSNKHTLQLNQLFSTYLYRSQKILAQKIMAKQFVEAPGQITI